MWHKNLKSGVSDDISLLKKNLKKETSSKVADRLQEIILQLDQSEDFNAIQQLLGDEAILKKFRVNTKRLAQINHEFNQKYQELLMRQMTHNPVRSSSSTHLYRKILALLLAAGVLIPVGKITWNQIQKSAVSKSGTEKAENPGTAAARFRNSFSSITAENWQKKSAEFIEQYQKNPRQGQEFLRELLQIIDRLLKEKELTQAQINFLKSLKREPAAFKGEEGKLLNTILEKISESKRLENIRQKLAEIEAAQERNQALNRDQINFLKRVRNNPEGLTAEERNLVKRLLQQAESNTRSREKINPVTREDEKPAEEKKPERSELQQYKRTR